MRKKSEIVNILSKVSYFCILILFPCCTSDTHYNSVVNENCTEVSNAATNDLLNMTGLKNSDGRSKNKNLVSRIKRNTLSPESEGLIPLFDDDSDLEHLTKFSATEFLDKVLAQRIFNTTMNVIVPMFHVILPMHAASGSTMHLAMQATLGLFSLAAWAVTVIVPSLFTYIIPFGYRSFGGTATTISKMSHFNHQKFNELSEKIGLDWNTCLKKTACEAHRFPKKYGIVSIFFQIFFPLHHNNMGREDYNVKTKHAVEIDVQDNSRCEEKFKCFFDILELCKYLIDLGYYNNFVAE